MTLLPKPSECQSCDLYGSGMGFSKPDGTGSLGLMVMAEALGEEEERDGKPLRPYAQSGAMFERLLKMCRLSRDQLVIYNTVNCRPPKNWLEKAPWEFSAISHCQVHRQRVIDQFKPRVILALGNVATRTLTGMAGEKQGVMYLRGYVLPALQGHRTNKKPCPDCLDQVKKGCFLCDGTGWIDEQSPIYSQIYVVPTVHPSFIQRGKKNFIPVATYDIQLALRTSDLILRGQKPTRKSVQYITRATLDEARSFYLKVKDSPNVLVTYDIETPNSATEDEDKRGSIMEDEEDEDAPAKKYPEDYSLSAEEYVITQIQFSIAPQTGIVFPWEGEFIKIAKLILALPNLKAGWNCFAKNTSVQMADRSWKPIWQVQIGDWLSSVNSQGKICGRQVTRTFHAQDSRPWIRVQVDGAYNRGTGRWGCPGVVCTLDHEWFLSDGSKRMAYALRPGDRVILPSRGSEDLVHGTLLGDGHANRNNSCRLRFSQTNRAWAQAKADNFGGTAKPAKISRGGYPNRSTPWWAETTIPSYWRRIFYNGKQKLWIAPPSMKALAVLYGDDGWINKGKTASFALHSFKPQLEEIKAWFTEQFGSCAIFREGELRLHVGSSRKFFESIACFLHPSVQYKLPVEFQGRYNNWLKEQVPQIGVVLGTEPVRPRKKETNHKYCLEVDDTHRFFTRAGLVSNCWDFDDPRLRSNGCVINGPSEDLMWKWHHLQPDLPAGLQFACSFLGMDYPWKHLATMGDMGQYGCADVDAPQRAYPLLTSALKAKRIERGYERHIRRLAPILWAAADRGIPVNREKLKSFEDKITLAQQELADQKIKPKVQGMDLGNVEPKGGFKPTNTGKVRSEELMSLINSGKTFDEISQIVHRNKEGDSYRYLQKEFVEPQKVDLFEGNLVSDPVAAPVVRWCRQFDFNPGSAKQIMAYMAAKKHPIPTAWKTDKPTTAKEELERLAKKVKDSFYTDILEYRKFDKMISTYCVGWRPKEDGCVHTTWTFRPAIGQTSTTNPNIQNCFSDDTEILTKRGWVMFPDLLETDLCAQWTYGGTVIFGSPERVIRQSYNGLLHYITTEEQIDIAATPKHNCLLQDRKTSRFFSVPAIDFKADARQIQAGIYVGGNAHYIEAQIALICALQADGYVMPKVIDKKGRSRGSGGAYDFFFAKERKIARFERCLNELNIPYRKVQRFVNTTPRNRLPGMRFYIARKDVPSWWQDKKYFGPWILDLTRESLDYLAEEIWFWDGCSERRSMYSSSVKSNADWGQIITILSNRRAKVRVYAGEGNRNDNWQVDASLHSYSLTTNLKNEARPYNGMVYCVTMPSGTIIVRRNGKVAFTGNCPTHVGLAEEFRDCIEAPAGHHIVELDYKSFFVITMGFEAKDEQWIRMGRMDIHSYLGAYALHLPERDRLISMPDDELRDRLSWIKKNYQHERDYKWKRAVLGYNNGLGYRKLYHQHQEYFSGENEAKQLLQTLDAQFPIACAWREEVIHRAQRDYRLVSRHGYHRLFHDVLVYWGQGKIEDAVRRGRKIPPVCKICKQRHENGEEAEQAKAYLAANNAFGHIKDAIIRASDQDEGPWDKERYMASWLGRAGFCNTIHDSIVCIMPDSLIDQALPAIYNEMVKPSTILVNEVAPDGLVCDVEAKIGKTWKKKGLGSMETISIHTGMSVTV